MNLSDVYSLGLTFLYILSLENPESNNEVNHDNIDALLNSLINRYSFNLLDIVR